MTDLTLDIPKDPLRLALRPQETARALGISERLLWSMTKEHQIPHVRLGRVVVYPICALERWLAEGAEQTSKREHRLESSGNGEIDELP